MKPSGPGLLFAERFLITVSISVLVMGLLRFSISSWSSFGKLYFSITRAVNSYRARTCSKCFTSVTPYSRLLTVDAPPAPMWQMRTQHREVQWRIQIRCGRTRADCTLTSPLLPLKHVIQCTQLNHLAAAAAAAAVHRYQRGWEQSGRITYVTVKQYFSS